MRKFQVVAIVLCTMVAFIASCAFLPRKDRRAIMDLETGRYVMQTDLTVNAERHAELKKGDEVTLKVLTGSDWIKIYGYNAAIDPLLAPQVLLLYMFSTDFPNEKFSMPFFQDAFDRTIKKKGESDEKAPVPSIKKGKK